MKILNTITSVVLLFSIFISPAAEALSKSTITVAVVQLHTADVGNFNIPK